MPGDNDGPFAGFFYSQTAAVDHDTETGTVTEWRERTQCDCGALKARTTHASWCSEVRR